MDKGSIETSWLQKARGLGLNYTQEKGVSMLFKAQIIVQEHQEEKNRGDELLLMNLRNSSSPKFVNHQLSDYNRCTNAPFVY